MEKERKYLSVLGLLVQPAFAVEDGRVIWMNDGCKRFPVEPGNNIREMLCTGREEYMAMTGGTLHLTLQAEGRHFGANVMRMEGYDLFLPDAKGDDPRLEAMALAARDLRAPLELAMHAADKIAGQLPEDHPLKESSCRLNRGLMHILRTVSNLSDAWGGSMYHLSQPEYRDLADILEELLAKIRALLADSGHTLRYKVTRARCYGMVDVQSLERAVLNLVNNAVRFAEEGTPILVEVRKDQDTLQVEVSNQGRIEPHILGDLFHRYTRRPELEDSRHGIGLGILLVRAAATIHGGSVLMDTPGSDVTRVVLSLPLSKEPVSWVRAKPMPMDYSGAWDHARMELAPVLKSEEYDFF